MGSDDHGKESRDAEVSKSTMHGRGPRLRVISFIGGMCMCCLGMLMSRLIPDSPCLLLMPWIVVGVMGWWCPRGAPGGSLAVATFFFMNFNGDDGPTAKAITLGYSIVVTIIAVVVEFAVAAKRLDVIAERLRLRRPRRRSPMQ